MRAILHNIRSMHNVGSIFRTADAAGIEKLYLTGYTPAPVDEWGRARPQLVKVSLGAEKIMLWEKYVSVTQLIKKLKKEGYAIIAVEQHKNAIFLPDFYKFYTSKLHSKFCRGKICVAFDNVQNNVQKTARYILVMGNEVRGLSPAILKRTDAIVEIPMRGRKESLNVAVAFGIAAYWFLFLKPR